MFTCDDVFVIVVVVVIVDFDDDDDDDGRRTRQEVKQILTDHERRDLAFYWQRSNEFSLEKNS
jgi:hypothetical protein